MNLFLVTDGGSRGNPGPSASAAICYDSAGTIIWEKGILLEGDRTNNWAEYAAVVLALQETLSRGENEAHIELLSDSSIVINQINGKYKVNRNRNKLHVMYDEAKELLEQFPNITFKHIPRDFSQDADNLVNKVLDENRVNNKNVPNFLKTKFQHGTD